jgi:hypothetical protein
MILFNIVLIFHFVVFLWALPVVPISIYIFASIRHFNKKQNVVSTISPFMS